MTRLKRAGPRAGHEIGRVGHQRDKFRENGGGGEAFLGKRLRRWEQTPWAERMVPGRERLHLYASSI